MARLAKEHTMFLVKTEMVCHFVNMLAKVVDDIQPCIEEAGLPANILTTKHQYMPEIPVRNLLDMIQKKCGETQFQKMLWTSCQTLFIPQMLYRIKKAETVQQAIVCFLEVRKEDAPHSQIEFKEALDKMWLGRHKTPEQASWFELSEQFVVVYLIELVRALSRNEKWLPTQLSIQSNQAERYQKLLAQQNGGNKVQIVSERNYSAIAITDEVLEMPYYPKLHWQEKDEMLITQPNFFESLKKALPAYLCAGKLPVSKAAQITGMSVRTLQRHLKAAGLSYRELLEEAQFNQAKLLLQDNEHSITAVANHLGYSNISHFSRAFKKATGIAPSKYKA